MAGFEVDTGTMRASGQQIMAEAQQIKQDLNRLSGQLAGLSSGWAGLGFQSFTGAQARYEAANQKLNTTLDQVSQLILANEVQYSSDDQQAQSGLNAAGSGMDVSIPGL